MSLRPLGYSQLSVSAPVVRLRLRQLYHQPKARHFFRPSHIAGAPRSQPAATRRKIQIDQYRKPTVSCTRPYTSEDISFRRLNQRTVQAAFPSSTVLVGLLVLFVSIPILNHVYGKQDKKKASHPKGTETMTPKALPGRPGSLTAEEEVKLRSLWQVMFRVFGVAESSSEVPGNDGAETASSTPAAIDTAADPAKRKRGRLGLLKRKPKEDENEEALSTSNSGTSTPMTAEAIANGIGPNDKHGMAKAFKEAIANTKPEEIREAFWDMVKHDHPDALLLRFLRARKWDVNAAAVMAVSALHWRLAVANVDSDIMFKGEMGMIELTKSSDAATKKDGTDFMDQIRMGKSFIHGVDKEGRPCCFMRVRLHKPGEQSESSLERFTIFTIETTRMLLQPPVDTATVVFDMTDFSLSNMDSAPLKFIIKCFEANYPESLGTVLIHKAPWIFQGLWKIIRGWLDPVVANKVHFTNSVTDLSEFIDTSSILAELGGPNPWTYKYEEPAPGENDIMKDVETKGKLLAKRKELAKDYEDLVLTWLATEEGKSDDWNQLRSRRNGIADQLRTNYWDLDPFLRARSLYDRNGDIKTVLSRPSTAKAAQPSQAAAVPAAATATTTSESDLD